MADPLRPLSTRELLHRSISLYRHHFRLFAGVSIIGPVAAFTCRMYAGRVLAAEHSGLRPVTAWMVAGIAIGITIMLLGGLAISSAATARAVASVWLGRETRVSEAYFAFKGRFWRITGIGCSVFIQAFLRFALFIGLGMIALALAATLGYNSRVEAGTVGMVCGSIAVIAAAVTSMEIYIRYAVAVQACVMEGLSRKQALKRSALLTGGDYGRVAAVYGVFVMGSFVVGFILEASTLLLLGHGIAFHVSHAAASFIAAALASPLGTIGMSLIYFDERVRKEAFDRQAMLAALEPALVQSVAERPTAQE